MTDNEINFIENEIASILDEISVTDESDLQGLSLTAQNYETAVERLKERFGDKQVLIDRHYRDLNQIPPAKNHTKSLRYTLDMIEKHINCLQNLGESSEQRIFYTIISSKFPIPIKIELEKLRLGDEGETSTNTLLRRIKKLITAQERVFMGYSSSFSNAFLENNDSSAKFTTETLVGGEASYKYQKKCFFCSKEHFSDECTQFPNLEVRKNLIKGCCFNCFSRQHMLRWCPVQKPCFHCKAKKKHHRSICPKLFQEAVAPADDSDREERVEKDKESEFGVMAITERVSMQTFSVNLKKPDKVDVMTVRGMLDTGSQRSYITEHLCKQLELQCYGKQILSVFVFGSSHPKQLTTSLVNLDVLLKDGSKLSITVNVVPSIVGKLNNFVDYSQIKLPPHLKLSDQDKTKPIELLIGNDYYHDFVLNRKSKVQKGLYLIETKVGWILSGRYSDNSKRNNETLNFLTYTYSIVNAATNTQNVVAWIEPDFLPFENSNDKDNLKFLWDLETLGIKDHAHEMDDDVAVQSFNNSIKYHDKRYHVSWPWKHFPPLLPSHYGLALGRLKSLIGRIKDRKILKEYNKIFGYQLEKGIIEKIDPNNFTDNQIIHYLPHHAVITPEKSTKIRIVFDGSAKTKKSCRSLNECLYRGRLLLEDLVGLLLRFRMHKYVVTADVEKAFLQIGLHEHDRDVTRFLWLKDVNKPFSPENLQVFRFCRVAFGIISSPFLLNAVVKHHLSHNSNKLSEKLSHHMYVDNLVIGCDSKDEVMNMYSEGKIIFDEASMNLRNWMSNHVPLNKLEGIEVTESKVLGILWKIKTDTLIVRGKEKPYTNSVNKRDVSSYLASFFDPLGFFSPILIQAKWFLQTLWEEKMNWDETLNSEQEKSWKMIVEILKQIPLVNIPRFVGRPEKGKVELHCFTDASLKAFSAAVYLRYKDAGTFYSNLIFSKVRVATKNMSIPRLELMGVWLGALCLNLIKKELDIEVENIFLWTDSKCVLHWLNSNKILPIFVENRLREIKMSKDINFKFVNSEQNPADLATKEQTCEQLGDFWWKGPSWLTISENLFPCEVRFSDIEAAAFATEEIEFPLTQCVLPILNPSKMIMHYPFDIDINKFSSVKIILKITSYCLRFINNLKSNQKQKGLLSAKELADAKLIWIKFVQRNYFQKTLEDMSRSKFNDLQHNLGLWLDKDGVLRCKGRVISEEFDYEENFPILLPNKESFTGLLIKYFHFELFHAGISHTLAEMRKEYWVIKGRTEVGKILKRCLICKIWGGGPYRIPKMPPLPIARISRTLPFENTGLDYLGPLYVRHPKGQKIWVCLFTCLTTRGIHLEVVQDLTTDEFLLALRRFVARRGLPRKILSDNAAQFKTVKGLFEATNNSTIHDYSVNQFLSERNITWQFIPELAPWAGGVYERLIGMVKRCLRRSVGRSTLTLCQLITVLTEVESILNSRPLTFIGSDIDSNNIITPAHFLSLRQAATLGQSWSSAREEDPDFLPCQNIQSRILENWKKGQGYLNDFWQLWKTEYLFQLKERKQTRILQGRILSKETPKLGAVVHIGDRTPRGTWRLARIVELNPGQDQEIRVAKVLLPNGRILTRSIGQLYPIEIDVENEPIVIPSQLEDTNRKQRKPVERDIINSEEHKMDKEPRPQRRSAELAKKRLLHTIGVRNVAEAK